MPELTGVPLPASTMFCVPTASDPDPEKVQPLAMAFIGLLRILEIPNCLASVTGAKKDVVGGAVYLP